MGDYPENVKNWKIFCRYTTNYQKKGGAFLNKRGFFRGVLSALITVILIASAVTGYAWLKTDKSTQFRLGTDDTPDISLKIASWDPKTKKFQWEPNWTPVEPNHTNKAPYGKGLNVDDVKAGDAPAVITGTLRTNCQFGEITNLTALDQSNEVWFCLKIHEDEGLEVKNLRVHFAEIPYQFYGAVWAGGVVQDIKPIDRYEGVSKELHPQASDIKQKLNAITADTHKKLMEVSRPEDAAFICATPPEKFTIPTGLSPQKDYVRLASGDDSRTGLPGNSPAGGMEGKASTLDNHYYYVYFKVKPNLESYFKFVQNLYAYMPCYLTFQDLRVNVDVVKKNTAVTP